VFSVEMASVVLTSNEETPFTYGGDTTDLCWNL
jgi:hypothetical protein